jgi:hypothetical protein
MAIYDGHLNRRSRLEEVFADTLTANAIKDLSTTLQWSNNRATWTGVRTAHLVKLENPPAVLVSSPDYQKLLYISLALYPIVVESATLSSDCIIDSKRIMSQRYSLSLRVPAASVIGVLLYSDHQNQMYMDILKRACKITRKELVFLSIGLLSEPKLANFPSIDLFVMMGELVPKAVSSSYAILNVFEFLAACTDSFFSLPYGDIETALQKILIEVNECELELLTERKSSLYYGLDDRNAVACGDDIVVGHSGWSRSYSNEACLFSQRD